MQRSLPIRAICKAMSTTWLLVLASSSALAVNRYWTGPADGNWDTDTSWTGSIEPGTADNALLDNGALVTVDQSGKVAYAVYLGYSENMTGRLRILTEGALTLGNWPYVGNGTGSSGSLLLDGGILTLPAATQLRVGAGTGSKGVLSIANGSSLNSPYRIYLGYAAGSTGTLQVAANSAFTSVGAAYVGYGSTGVVQQTGGAITFSDQIYLGQTAGTRGTCDSSGGTVYGNSNFNIYRGALNLSGSASCDVLLIQMSGPDAHIKVSGSATLKSRTSLYSGVGTNTIMVTGGSLIATNTEFRVGYSADHRGWMTVDGGGVLMSRGRLGNNGTAICHVKSGSLRATERLELGYGAGTGVVHLSGGVCQVKALLMDTLYDGTSMINFTSGRSAILYIDSDTEATIPARITKGEICVDGVIQTTASAFLIKNVVGGPYDGHVEIKLKPSAAIVLVR